MPHPVPAAKKLNKRVIQKAVERRNSSKIFLDGRVECAGENEKIA
jgi:hypothetical protein